MMQGGRDVVGSAARAPERVARQFDRSAVSDKAVIDSPDGANVMRVPGSSATRADGAKSGGDRNPVDVALVTAGETALQFQAKASEDNGVTGKATMRRADCMTGEVSRVGAGRTVPATSEGKDATAGRDRHRNSNSSVSVAEPTIPEAAKSPCPRPAVSGDSLATFHCPEWTRSMGTCCPEGAVRHECPALLERQLELAERDLICADYVESTAKMLREKEEARARIASIKRQIAERDERLRVENAAVSLGDRHAG